MNTSSPTITVIGEANVHDGKGGFVQVRPGDKVELINPSHVYLELYGPGPFTISWIGQWRCGRKELYFKLPNGGEPGARASECKIVG